MLNNYFVIFLTLTFGFAISNGLKYKAELAKSGEFPYAVSLRKSNGQVICSGTIIGDKYVVTTVNCAVDTKGYTLKDQIPLFAHAGSISREVEAAIYLKKYTQPYELFGLNIAVLKLKSGFDLAKNPSIAKVNLPDPTSHETYEGKIVTELGFTRYEMSENGEGTLTLTKNVYKSSTQVLPNIECQLILIGDFKDGHLCAYHFNHDNKLWSCWMDRGSPLIYNNTIIGLQFLGPNKNCKASPIIFMRISSYLEFINNAMKENYTSDMVVAKL